MLLRQSIPRIRARPALGRRNPSSVRISVDLPDPLGPSNPTAFPVPETPRRQVIPWRISRRPSFTLRFSSSTTAVVSKTSPSLTWNGIGLLSHTRPTQVLEQHHIHDQSRDAITAGRM